jgi:hypothetical protein
MTARRRRPVASVRHAIIPADDFGKVTENNRGIIAAHRARAVNTINLMMGASRVGEALDLLSRSGRTIGPVWLGTACGCGGPGGAGENTSRCHYAFAWTEH